MLSKPKEDVKVAYVILDELLSSFREIGQTGGYARECD
jgi:hypothetical protein